MKRFIAFLLFLVLLVSSAGCFGGDDVVEPTQDTSVTTAAPTQAPTAKPTAVPTPTPVPTPDPNEEFAELDRALFAEELSGDYTTARQYVAEPEAYGLTLPEPSWDSSDVDYSSMLERLEAINYEGLTERNKFAVDSLKALINYRIEESKYKDITDPFGVLGYHNAVPLTLSLFRVESVEDAESYLKLIESVPALFEELMETENRLAEEGLFMTQSTLRTVQTVIKAVPAAKDKYFLIASFDEKIDAISGLSEEKVTELKTRNKELITGVYFDAYNELNKQLQALNKFCRKDLPACEQENETYLDYFKFRLRESGGDDITPYVALKRLTKWMDRMAKEMDGRTLGLYIDPAAKDQNNVTFTMEETDEAVKYLKELTNEVLGELPEHNLEYYIPDKSISSWFSAAYVIPPLDKWQDNTMLLGDEKAAKDLLILAHETYPGHLYQAIYQRSKGDISLTQQLFTPTSYAEGWSQFSEYLVAESTTLIPGGTVKHLHNGYMYNIFTLSYCSVLVNCFNYTKAMLDAEFGYNMGWAYNQVMDMSYSYLDYAFGYINFMETYETAADVLDEGFNITEYAIEYLDCGPSRPELLGEHMQDWAEQNVVDEAVQQVDQSVSAEFNSIDEQFYKDYVTRDAVTYLNSAAEAESYGIKITDVNWAWPSYTKESWDAWHSKLKEYKEKLDAIERLKLPEQERVGYDTLKRYIELELEGEKFYGYEDVQTYPQSILVRAYYMLNSYPIETTEDVNRYFTLLEDMPRLLEELLAYEQYRNDKKIQSKNEDMVAYGNVLTMIQKECGKKGESELRYHFDISTSNMAGMGQKRFYDLQQKNTDLILESFLPALTEFIKGYSAIGRGESATIRKRSEKSLIEYYEYRIKVDTGYTPDEFSTHLYDNIFYFYDKMSDAFYSSTGRTTRDMMSDDNVVILLKEMTADRLPKVEFKEIRPVWGMLKNIKPFVSERYFSGDSLIIGISYIPWAGSNKTVLMETQSNYDMFALLERAQQLWPGKAYLYSYVAQSTEISAAQKALMPRGYTEGWGKIAELYAANNNCAFDKWGISYYAYMHMFFMSQRHYDTLVDNYYNGKGYSKTTLTRLFRYANSRAYPTVFEQMDEAASVITYYELLEKVKTKQGDDFNEDEFITYYLSLGPTYPEIITEYVLAHYNIA